jgi:hypothetical protein
MSDKYTPGPVQMLARLSIQSARYQIEPEFAAAVDILLNSTVYDVAPEYHAIAIDSLPILEAVLEDREESNGEEDEVLRDLIDRLRAAIAKAEGRS